MKMNLLFLLALLMLLTACNQDPAQNPDQSAAVPPQSTEDTAVPDSQEPAVPEPDTASWEVAGYVLETPADWADRFLINPAGERYEESGTLFEICHRETYQAGEAYGWVLSITRWDEAQYQIGRETGEMEVLATDDEGCYYCKCLPTDVQFSDDAAREAMRDFRESQELADVLAEFVSRNGLTAWTE